MIFLVFAGSEEAHAVGAQTELGAVHAAYGIGAAAMEIFARAVVDAALALGEADEDAATVWREGARRASVGLARGAAIAEAIATSRG